MQTYPRTYQLLWVLASVLAVHQSTAFVGILQRDPIFRERRTCSSSPLSASKTAASGRSKKRSNKKKQSKTAHSRTNRSGGGPISLQELAEHVSNEYIHGPGGLMRDVERKRNRNNERTTTSPQETTTSEQDQVVRNLDRHPALVLNADFQPLSYLPLSLWHWQEAVKAIFSGKVQVVDVYPDVTIRAANLQVPVPSVIALTEYVRPQFHHHKPAFTKRNVFLRDEYRCQYCNSMFHTRDLSLDHVVPRCRGGHLNWENAVTCCTGCNGKKGSMNLRELQTKHGMKLLTTPRVPTQYELAMTASRMLPRRVHSTWEPYLPQQPVPNGKNRAAAAAREHQQEEALP